jgi:uridine phosphorylase
MDQKRPPILSCKYYDQESVFFPENLLREARRQKNIGNGQVPSICILDPDGDILSYLKSNDMATLNAYWACYHTELYDFEHQGIQLGIIGSAVGASFAVLLAEQLFVSGCQLLISITSSGIIAAKQKPPFFILIDQAYRDEGTSYHYVAPSDYCDIDPELLATLSEALQDDEPPIYIGASWTTDAPFRETASAIQQAKNKGILAVEMEASALYAFAQAREKKVVCFAHVTNSMGSIEGDFEKGEENGSKHALKLIESTAQAWLEKLNTFI